MVEIYRRLIGAGDRMVTSRRGFMQSAVTLGGGVVVSAMPAATVFARDAANVATSETKIHGETAKGFERVRDAFTASAAEMGRGGAAFAAYLHGKKVINVWAGQARPGVPWDRHTVSLFFSSTKVVPGLVSMLLVDQGKLQLDVPVAKYWPEFAAKGKEAITVRQLLAMEGGLVYVPGYEGFLIPNGGGWDQIDEIERRLAESAPMVPPGTPAYAMLNFGYLVNAIVRRISGRPVKDIFNEDIAKPLALDLSLGAPGQVLSRAAELYPFDESREPKPGSLNAKALHEVNGQTILQQLYLWGMNPVHLHSGAGSGDLLGTAEGMARLYAMVLGGGSLDGVKVLSPEVIKTFLQIQSDKVDVVAERRNSWMLGGFQGNPPSGDYSPGSHTFGKAGAGGQIGFGDPDRGLAIGFLRSHMTWSSPLLPNLVKAIYACL